MIVDSLEKLAIVGEDVAASNIISLDTETTPIKPGRVPNLVGISIATVGISKQGIKDVYYIPVGHKPGVLDPEPANIDFIHLIPLFELIKHKCEVVFHNAKFDLAVLQKQRLEVGEKIHDTMIYSFMVDENRFKSLGFLGELYFGAEAVANQEPIKKMAKTVGGDFSKIPIQLLGPYACEDAVLTLRLYFRLVEQLADQELLGLTEREMEFLKVLLSIEERGIWIETDLCRQLADEADQRLSEIQSKLGFDPAKRNLLAERLFAEPPKGRGLPVESRTKYTSPTFPEGVPTARGPWLEQFKEDPVVADVLEYRMLRKAVSTWYRGFLEKLGPDHKLHPRFQQAGPVTTRLSCRDPNLQQIPRSADDTLRGRVKKVFVPSEGYELITADYSQIELRLAAVYSQEPDLMEAFISDGDLHQLTADKLQIERYAGKVINFATLYGAGAGKLSDLLNITEDEAHLLLKEYWTSYPKLAEIKYRTTILASQRGYIKLWTGRRRHVDSDDAHKAFNSLLQGGAGEIIKSAMILLDKENYRMVNQVHDELWFEIPVGEVDKQMPNICNIMLEPTKNFGLPFSVDWGAIDEK